MDYSTLYSNNAYSNSYDVISSAASSATSGAVIWSIIAIILAIVGGILVYFLFVKSKNEPKGKFTKWLKDFLGFNIMWLESILKVLYYIGTIFVILISFALIPFGILAFLCCLILGPIAVRLIYEATMMFIMIWKNTTIIAKNSEKK